MNNKAFSFLFFMVIWLAHCQAQDSHYWTSRYGTKSTLLGGAVVGSHLDISSTFYNPGALGIADNPAFVITGWVFNMTALTFESAAGDDNDINSLQIAPAPDYLTGVIPTSSKNKWGYTFLTRYRFQDRLFTRDSFYKDVLFQEGDEFFSGDYYVDQDIRENWVGLSWSRGLSDIIGVGVTSFASYRSQKFRSTIHNVALANDNNAAHHGETRHYSYYNYRILFKLGLAADFSPLKLGISITTPSINVLGSGSSYVSRTILGMSVKDLPGENFIECDDQTDLKSVYKSPVSIAIGASFNVNKTTIHASAEWFNATGAFDVLPIQSSNSQATGEPIDHSLVRDLRAVLNFGAGVERKWSKNLEMYASFVTDYSAVSPESMDNLSITSWDIYHIMAGASLRLWRSEITAGVGYSFGQSDVKQRVDFDSAHETNLLLGDRSERKAIYRNLTFLVGFSVFPTELFQGLPFFNNKKE